MIFDELNELLNLLYVTNHVFEVRSLEKLSGKIIWNHKKLSTLEAYKLDKIAQHIPQSNV